MPRPTPARILYLLIGLVLGLAATIAAQIYLLPGLLGAIPFFAPTPPPVVVAGPRQFTAAALERVLMLGQAQERNGVTMRLNTVEIYRDGFSFTYAMTGGGTGVSPLTLEPETFIVSDDRNTGYNLAPAGTAAAPSAGLTVGIASFTPAPPPEAAYVRIIVPNALALGLRPSQGQLRVIGGPWEFQVPLRG